MEVQALISHYSIAESVSRLVGTYVGSAERSAHSSVFDSLILPEIIVKFSQWTLSQFTEHCENI